MMFRRHSSYHHLGWGDVRVDCVTWTTLYLGRRGNRLFYFFPDRKLQRQRIGQGRTVEGQTVNASERCNLYYYVTVVKIKLIILNITVVVTLVTDILAQSTFLSGVEQDGKHGDTEAE